MRSVVNSLPLNSMNSVGKLQDTCNTRATIVCRFIDEKLNKLIPT